MHAYLSRSSMRVTVTLTTTDDPPQPVDDAAVKMTLYSADRSTILQAEVSMLPRGTGTGKYDYIPLSTIIPIVDGEGNTVPLPEYLFGKFEAEKDGVKRYAMVPIPVVDDAD